ncbi:MAG: VanW family protein [Chloroflexi bacterium]|nr:VanW family protein [Chloroflexota bacterium]
MARIEDPVRGSRGQAGAPPAGPHPALVLVPYLLAALVLFGAAVVTLATYQRRYEGRIYPGVSVMGVDLGGHAPAEARLRLAAALDQFARTPIAVRFDGKEWAIPSGELGLRFDLDRTIQTAYAVGRIGSRVEQLETQIHVARNGAIVSRPEVVIDRRVIESYLNSLGPEIGRTPVDAQIELKPGQRVVLVPSQPGRRLEVAASADRIVRALNRLDGTPVDLMTAEVPPAIADRDLQAVKGLAEKMLGGPIILTLDDRRWEVSRELIAASISLQPAKGPTASPTSPPIPLSANGPAQERPPGGEGRTGAPSTPDLFPPGEGRGEATPSPLVGEGARGRGGTLPGSGSPPVQVHVDDSRFRALVKGINKEIERAPRNARFDLQGGQLRAIAPGADGRAVDVDAAVAAIRQRLGRDDRTIVMPVTTLKPAVGSADAAKLAGLQLIESASTVYGGTLPDRMYNVELAVSRINGTLIAPGETFSFNQAAGEVSYRSGYKQAYGITQSGDEVQTIPSEGGGICQVATTVFQAAFWAGLPMVERNWHLYWIPRYGQPPRGLTGLDATIDQVYDKNYNLLYAVDLRFTNSTEGYLLLQARTNGRDVVVSLYGKKPSWTVQVDKPIITDVVKADHTPVRQADKSLAPGTELMIEHAEDGFRSTIVRKLVQDGKVVDSQKFVSTYRPSRNVYLYGPPRPTPVPATPTPGAAAQPGSVQPGATATPQSAPARPTTAPPGR